MDKLRTFYLAIICGSVFFALAKTFYSPIESKTLATPFVFPQAVPLSKWKPLDSNALETKGNILAGNRYRYLQNHQTLDIEMRYMGPSVYGDINTFMERYRPSLSGTTSMTLLQGKDIGFYSLFSDKTRAYLSACINSRGGSTVTAAQFKQNRFMNDVTVPRVLAWFMGQSIIPDRRCLWANLSIPLKDSSPEEAYRVLEPAWFSWYGWWHTRFPKR